MKIEIRDIVKWGGEMSNEAEKRDVMLVDAIEGRYIRVRHIGEPLAPLSMVTEESVRRVGKWDGVEPAGVLYEKYKSK